MIRLPFVLLFTAMTALSWGVYGIVLHKGANLLGHSTLRAFIGVGIAYFLIAVLIPLIWLASKKEKGHWTIIGSILSLLAGTVGALGALGVTLAVAFKGNPLYVMPIVFGGAPVVNTLVTSWINKSFSQIKPMFIVGMVMVGLGMIGVLTSKPNLEKIALSQAAAAAAVNTLAEVNEASAGSAEATPADGTDDAVANAAASDEEIQKYVDEKVEQAIQAKTAEAAPAEKSNSIAIGASILLAVVCWGAYGPILHLGQMRMGGSRLRPFCCVGIAYFLIAVIIPVLILMTSSDGVQLTFNAALPGMGWSILAGAAGAVGALGIILAFNYGGKPVFVMPLVFGFAPVINTLVSISIAGAFGHISPFFAASLLLGIAGAVTVLLFAPKAKPHATPAATN